MANILDIQVISVKHNRDQVQLLSIGYHSVHLVVKFLKPIKEVISFIEINDQGGAQWLEKVGTFGDLPVNLVLKENSWAIVVDGADHGERVESFGINFTKNELSLFLRALKSH